jgi:hypothetical protein
MLSWKELHDNYGWTEDGAKFVVENKLCIICGSANYPPTEEDPININCPFRNDQFYCIQWRRACRIPTHLKNIALQYVYGELFYVATILLDEPETIVLSSMLQHKHPDDITRMDIFLANRRKPAEIRVFPHPTILAVAPNPISPQNTARQHVIPEECSDSD